MDPITLTIQFDELSDATRNLITHVVLALFILEVVLIIYTLVIITNSMYSILVTERHRIRNTVEHARNNYDYLERE